jgi:hypothetical protein
VAVMVVVVVEGGGGGLFPQPPTSRLVSRHFQVAPYMP